MRGTPTISATYRRLAGLTKLTVGVGWRQQSISVIYQSVAGLTNLTLLRGFRTTTSRTYRPLVANTGLVGRGEMVKVQRKSLELPIYLHLHIPALQARGVEVTFDTRTPEGIGVVTGNNQQGFRRGAALEKPFVVEVQGSEMVLCLKGFQLRSRSPVAAECSARQASRPDSNGQAESTLTLGPNPGTNTVTVSDCTRDSGGSRRLMPKGFEYPRNWR